MGSVTVTRDPGGFRDLVRAYSVEIDGEVVGKLVRGQSLTVEVGPGSRAVRMTIDWCSSQRVIVQGEKNETLVCKPGGSALLGVIDILFRPGEYISLERA